MSKILCKHHYVNFVSPSFFRTRYGIVKNRCLPNLKPSFRPSSFPTRPYLCNPFTPRRMCRFSIFMFTVGNEAFYVALPVFPSPAAQVPPQAARQVQTPRAAPAPQFRSGASDASSPSSDTHAQNAAVASSGSAHPSFPSQSHHCTAEGRKAGTRPYRLPYSHLIQSAAHRQIGRKRQQHQICTHRRRQAEHDRPHRQSLLLHSIAPHPSRSKSVCRKAAFYIQALRKKCAKKRRPNSRRVRIGFT